MKIFLDDDIVLLVWKTLSFCSGIWKGDSKEEHDGFCVPLIQESWSDLLQGKKKKIIDKTKTFVLTKETKHTNLRLLLSRA